ncbi:MAG: hypothetical protein WB800_15405, partial [Streptosporangiaceae bacterium]
VARHDRSRLDTGHRRNRRSDSRHPPGLASLKLPLAPEELRRLGHDIPDLYPDLVARWDAGNKQWRWAVPTLEAIPDVVPAIELTSRYQPLGGPMLVPAS